MEYVDKNSVIYEIAERGHMYLAHWFLFMIAGLRHISNDKLPKKICFEKPISDHGYEFETLDILKDEYVMVTPTSDDIIVKNYGEPLVTINGTMSADKLDDEAYRFLRNLFLSRLPLSECDGSLYYISRKKFSNGRRNIINESEFYSDLELMGFKIICLEDFNVKEKINIFQKAKMVVCAYGSALIFSMFANPTTKIVEICPDIHQHKHYKNSCAVLKLPYYHYTNVETVGESPGLSTSWDIKVDKNDFLQYITDVLKN